MAAGAHSPDEAQQAAGCSCWGSPRPAPASSIPKEDEAALRRGHPPGYKGMMRLTLGGGCDRQQNVPLARC
jgi:hypothetical protein